MKLLRHPTFALVAVSAGLGTAFSWLVLGYQTGAGATLFFFLVLACFWLLSRLAAVPMSRSVWALALPVGAFALMLSVRESAALTVLNVGACCGLLLLMAVVAFRRRLRRLTTGELLATSWLPIRFVLPAYDVVVHRLAAPVAKSRRWGRVLLGIGLTLPVVVIFAALFASADLVVQTYAARLFSWSFDGETVSRFVMALFVTAFFIGGFAYIFDKITPGSERHGLAKRRPIGRLETGILLSSVNLMFFGFILVQATYLFGGPSSLTALGLTYAEYARKGFFELVTIAVLTFVILWLADRYVQRSEGSHDRWFTIWATVLIMQVLVIMGSAFWRLYLYEQAFGFTSLRFYAHAGTIFLGVMMVILALKIIRSAPSNAFAFPALLALIMFVAVLNAVNPDAFIARQNLERFNGTGKIDREYLGRLSADARNELLKIGSGDSKRSKVLDWREWSWASR